MSLNSVEALIDDIRQGKMVILMDDETRENEGDLIVASEKVTPDIINFMIKEARGLVCMTLTGERCDYLKLNQMVSDNREAQRTAFTVSIEAASGVTTGISAHDRARTIRVAIDKDSRPEDVVQPGHIFPLRAMTGGVLSRAGHTEAGCDLARLAGLQPSAAIIEIMKEDGTMARHADLELFADKHHLKIGTIADLIHYRIIHEKTVERRQEQLLKTIYGNFRMTVYDDIITGRIHLALALGRPSRDRPALVRVHQADIFRDLLGACKADSHSWPLPAALARVAQEGEGVIVLLDADECSLRSDSLQQFIEPVPKASHNAGRAYLTVGTGSQILRDQGVGQMKLLSAPMKFGALSGFGLKIVEYVPCE